MKHAAWLFPFLASLSGCIATQGASRHAEPAVRVQAQSDLDCPQRDIRVVQGIGGKYEARGCGHKAVYNTACDLLRCVVAPEGQDIPWRSRPNHDDPLDPTQDRGR